MKVQNNRTDSTTYRSMHPGDCRAPAFSLGRGHHVASREIQKRFTHLQQTLSEASRTCHADATIPTDLMTWVDELDKECKSVTKVMSSKDEDRIRQWVDLERIGDRADRACQQASGLDARIKDAVSSMHSELSDLKRQLH